MLNVLNLFIAFVICGLSVGLPIKDEEIDELIYRLQDLKHQNLYDEKGKGLLNVDYGEGNSRSHLHKVIDLELKPLLYDYYANTLNPIYHKRNFDEIDRASISGFNTKRNFDEIDRSSISGFHKKRNFDEIDRASLSGFSTKRNFDEIDRSSISGFNAKRNFDEIDRASLSGFSTNKRNFDEIDRSRLSGFKGKRNFDEIDRSRLSGFNGKRNFDEIDRTGLSDHYIKRNFDEIDRSSLSDLINHKRYNDVFHTPRMFFNEIDHKGFTDFMKRYYNDDRINTGLGNDRLNVGGNGPAFAKKNFDEIDRSALSGFKRQVRKVAESVPVKEQQQQAHVRFEKN